MGIGLGRPRALGPLDGQHLDQERLAGLGVALEHDVGGTALVLGPVVVVGEGEQELHVASCRWAICTVDVPLDLGPARAQVVEAGVHRVGDRVG